MSYSTRVPSYRGRRYVNTGPSEQVSRDVMARCLGRCERCGDQLTEVHKHHRRPRAMGGTSRPETNEHANLAALCPSCHREVESYRAEAYGDGWLVSQHSDPATVPVLLHRERWVYLGVGYTDAPEATP